MSSSPRSAAVKRAAMAAAKSPRNSLRKAPALQNIAVANATAKRLNTKASGRDLLAGVAATRQKATPRSGTAAAVKMLRKYAKKFGQLPERPEHLVAFAENYGGVRFVDARAAMRMTGINTLAADEEEEEAAAAAAAEREEREAREAAEAEAEAQAQAEAEVEMEMAAAAASQSASPPLERKMSERSSKKVALKRWLARHGFGAGDGLEVLDAVDIREIADFEFVEVRDLVDGGMKPATAQRLLDVFAEHGTNIPASPLASNSPRMSPVRRGPHDTDDEEENDDDDDVITGAHQRPPAAAQGFATPQLLKPASRSRTSSSPKQQKNTTPLPKPDFDDAQGGGDDGVNEHVDEFVDDFDDDDEDADAAKDSSAAEEAAAVAALPAISSPAVRKAVSNSARRQARWQTRVETFLQEHDPELLKQDGYVDNLIAQYRGREVAMLRFLRDKYTPKTAPAPAPEPKRMPSMNNLNNASFRTEATMSVGSPGSRGSSLGSDWETTDSDDEDDGAVDDMILKQFMERLQSTLSSEYGQHVLRIEAAVNNAKYDNDLNRITVRRGAPGDSLGCMVSTNRVAWRNHVFLEVTQVRFADEDRRIPGPAMAAGLRIGDIIVSILGDQTVNSLDHFKELCRDKTKIEMTIVRPAKADLSHISREELDAVQKVIEARVQTQQREILSDSKSRDRDADSSSNNNKPKSTAAADMSPATRNRKARFFHGGNAPRARNLPNKVDTSAAGSNGGGGASNNQKAASPVSPRRLKAKMSFSRVGLPPLTACRPFEPVDKRRGLVWFRLERSNNGRKFSLIDTKVEAALLVAEQKKLLAFDYEIRYGIGMRQLCLDEGGMDPALGLVKMSDVSKLRYVCIDVRKDASRSQPSHEELCYIRYKIINDRKFVTLVIPKSTDHDASFRRQSGPKVPRRHEGHIDLHDALRTHHKEMILTFENEPPEYDQSLGHHVAPTTAPRKVSEAFVASVKNFVLWSPDGPVMEFWRTGKNTYALAVGHPLTLVQAFTTAISAISAPS